MLKVSMKELLEAGVHFGHQTKRWNPKMAKFIFGGRSGIYIIDLEKTQELLSRACVFLQDIAARGGHVLFVGTKKQAQDVVREEALRCGAFFVRRRWLGGTLTNFQTIRKSVDRVKKLREMSEDGTFDALVKKEVGTLTKEKIKLEQNFEGIIAMDRLPDVLYIVDAGREKIAVAEANRLNIPVVAIVDTNTDPDNILYLVPGNDDAIKSVRLLTQAVADAILEGKQKFLKNKELLESEPSPPAEKPGADKKEEKSEINKEKKKE